MSGAWPPGTRIPAEHALMAEYGCSRMTVSKVLSGLATQGLITRRRGAGSAVASPRSDQAVLEIRDFAKEAARSGQPYRHAVLRRDLVAADAATATRLGLPPGSRLVSVHTLHQVAGVAEAYEQRLINLAAVPQAAVEPFTGTPPGTWLLDLVPWTSAEHAIEAIGAGTELARLLGIPPGTACLVLERRTWQAATFITEARITYPGPRHRLVGRFSPVGAPAPSVGFAATSPVENGGG